MQDKRPAYCANSFDFILTLVTMSTQCLWLCSETDTLWRACLLCKICKGPSQRTHLLGPLLSDNWISQRLHYLSLGLSALCIDGWPSDAPSLKKVFLQHLLKDTAFLPHTADYFSSAVRKLLWGLRIFQRVQGTSQRMLIKDRSKEPPKNSIDMQTIVTIEQHLWEPKQ